MNVRNKLFGTPARRATTIVLTVAFGMPALLTAWTARGSLTAPLRRVWNERVPEPAQEFIGGVGVWILVAILVLLVFALALALRRRWNAQVGDAGPVAIFTAGDYADALKRIARRFSSPVRAKVGLALALRSSVVRPGHVKRLRNPYSFLETREVAVAHGEGPRGSRMAHRLASPFYVPALMAFLHRYLTIIQVVALNGTTSTNVAIEMAGRLGGAKVIGVVAGYHSETLHDAIRDRTLYADGLRWRLRNGPAEHQAPFTDGPPRTVIL